jgi:hypothetical protein
VGVIPVCDGQNLTGLVTDRDITVRAVAEGRSGGCQYSIGTSRLRIIRPEACLHQGRLTQRNALLIAKAALAPSAAATMAN